MSHAGDYIRSGKSLFAAFSEGKPHSSITDWIEVLSSDRYDELSLDGIPELVESVNILQSNGTVEAARAIRKKLKYGNVHRQLRALVILRALTENAGKGFQLHWADEQIMGRLKEMAQDSLLDPKVKKRLILVFHAWSIQYGDEPRMTRVANLYKQYGHGPGAGPAIRKPVTSSGNYSSSTTTTTADPVRRGSSAFADTDDIYGHDWAPSKRGADTYSDLAQAREEAERRRMERDRQIALEQREAELERKEREQRRRQDMAALESRRQREAEEEAERRRQAKLAKNAPQAAQAKRPKFDLAKERPKVMLAIADAIQTANGLVNAVRHINRDYETITESPRVLDALDKAKAARRQVIRYIQVVQDETLTGTLLDANEKVVEAIQLFDKLSKPAALDSDSDHEPPKPAEPKGPSEMERLSQRMAAQKLEADRKTELQKLQEQQKRESAKRQQRQAQAPPRPARNAHPDLHDLDFGSIPKPQGSKLPPPLSPDSEHGSFAGGSLSDFSDYDSSDSEYRASYSRRQSAAPGGSHSRKQSASYGYSTLDDDFGGSSKQRTSGKGGRRPTDDFDPFADDNDTPMNEKPRMQWAEI